MAQNILFMIHGVGDQDKGWSKDAKKLLSSELKKYPSFKGISNPLPSRLKIVEIVYNDIFDDVLKNWRELSQDFKKVDAELMPGVLKSVNGFLGPTAGNGSLLQKNNFANRSADVLLFRGFTLVQKLVLLKVVQKIASGIASALRAAAGQSVKFGILGHSHGTAIAHDAMQVMATTEWLRDKNGGLKKFNDIPASKVKAADKALGKLPLGTGIFKFDSVYMVSNTSPLLFTTKSPYKSVVRPAFGSAIRGNTRKYVNINHKFDPVGMLRPMDINQWPAASALEMAIDLRPRHIHEKNIHALTHYLIDPEIHGHIFLDLVNDFTKADLGYAMLRKSPQTNLTDHPFPKYKGNFDKEEIKNQVEAKLRVGALEKLLAALAIVQSKVPELKS